MRCSPDNPSPAIDKRPDRGIIHLSNAVHHKGKQIMVALLTRNDINSVVIFQGQELPIKYRGKVRDCRIEQIEKAKGYIRVFDITSNDYRTFTINDIGK